MSFDPIPQARVVKKAGKAVSLAPAPRDEPAAGSLSRTLRDAFAIAMGMWPLTGCLLLILGLLVMAGTGDVNMAYYR